MDVRDQFCISCGSIKKKSSENEKETEKATTSTESLNEYLFEKRNERKKCKVTHKTSSTDRRKSMSWANCKTIDGSVTIEIGIMDTSKRSLEPVRGSKLPVKVGKYMAADEVRILAQKKHSDYDQFFSGLENYVLLYPDSKLVYHMPGTDEPFTVAKYKKELGKLYQKYAFIFARMRSTTSPVYSKDLQIQ